MSYLVEEAPSLPGQVNQDGVGFLVVGGRKIDGSHSLFTDGDAADTQVCLLCVCVYVKGMFFNLGINNDYNVNA